MEHPRQEEAEDVVPSNSPKKKGKRKALLIGISKYDHNNVFSNLDLCENDTNEIFIILKSQGYDIPANTKLVGRVEWARMRDEIIDFFEDSSLKPEDMLLFYFSGRGHLDKNTNRMYLSTSEIDPAFPKKRGIPFDELASYINDSNSERIVSVLDCCYSSALDAVAGRAEEEKQESTGAEKDEERANSAQLYMRKAVERLIRPTQGKCVLASSLDEKKSFKMKDQPYSIFTYFFIQGLRGANGESVDINGYTTLELLSSYLNKKFNELPKIKQKPIRMIDSTSQINLAYYPSLANIHEQTLQKSSHLIQLLKNGKIDEFNEIRKRDNYSRLNLSNIDLSELYLSNVDLRKSNLISSDLGESKLQHAKFEEATLLRAHLEGADVSKANVSKADLLEADLEFTKLEGADLSKADVARADLIEADVCKVDLSEANLSYANLSKADLSEANVSKANLSEANLSNADLSYANLSKANLSEANLSYANLSKANLSEANLVEADLSKADLLEANVSKANLSKADLSNADLSYANLSKADLSNADLSEANLSSSIIIEAKFLSRNNKKCYPRFRNTEFNDFTIIDSEELEEYIRNSSTKNVPTAIRNAGELRAKLEERGFDKETIERFLSFSALPDEST